MTDSNDRPFTCADAEPLIPRFVDGELSGAQGDALRHHLMECAACRSLVQEETSQRQWFVPSEEVPVPEGFAARVTGLAFAGGGHELTPVGSAPKLRLVSGGSHAVRFQMALSAAAAVLLIVTGFLIARGHTGADIGGGGLQADESELERIEQENAAEEEALRKEAAERSGR